MKKKQKFFTVGDLKKLLENIDESLPVGGVGHFGEFIPAESDFAKFCTRIVDLVPEDEGQYNRRPKKIKVFLVPHILLGPDPD